MWRTPSVTLAAAVAVGVLLPAGCNSQAQVDYRVVEAFPHLEFRRPVDFQSPRDGSNRLFVVEQDGVIKVFENDAGVKSSRVFLDIAERVSTRGNEMGLLGLAFHPRFSENGAFYVYYTASHSRKHKGRVSRFVVDPDNADRADADSETVVLEVDQPWSNHNGGQTAFGPDGYLYVGLGDGGSGGDPKGNGQNCMTMLGSIIRIDVDETPYGIPPDNPFAGDEQGCRPEIYAFGLRNPWRFSFDAETGALWTGDVGQVTWEEVDIVEKGKNYGWDCFEGPNAYQPAGQQSPRCGGDLELEAPVWSYGRDQGMSITGGYVYRGATHATLAGRYVYADYVTGKIWALDYQGGRATNRQLADADFFISSFGTDANSELYICAHDPDGDETKIYKLINR